MIGMGQNIHPGSAVREGTVDRDELVKNAHGFAQVLPKDKREVVLVLKDRFKYVVGMTGDGVNDAPALSAAQCGIAVDDATDAAKTAAAIVLTSPGLSAIYSAVVESRRIFRKLKAYVTYRFAATIQMVTTLSLLIYISNCSIDSLYIIVLALANDLTMLPIAYDLQQASKTPENPDVTKLLTVAFFLGVIESGFSCAFAWGVGGTHLGTAGPAAYQMGVNNKQNCSIDLQTAIWLQMFISAEILIFSARAPSYIWVSLRPSVALFCSVMLGCIIASLLAAHSNTWSLMPAQDVLLIWLYCMCCLVFIDFLKVQLYDFFGDTNEVLKDHVYVKSRHEHPGDQENTTGTPLRTKSTVGNGIEEPVDRGSQSANRLTDWAVSKSERLSNMTAAQRASLASGNRRSISVGQERASTSGVGANIDVSSGRASLTSAAPVNNPGSFRKSLVTMGSLRPNTPSANLAGKVIRG